MAAVQYAGERDAAHYASSAVIAEGFAFTYAGQSSPVLTDVTMDVPEGAFAVVCGNTGSGKTTLLKCMTEALAPAGEHSGRMTVFGCEAPGPPDVGFVMQDPESQIVCDTVRRELAFGLENLGMEPDAMRLRLAEVVTVFGIERLVDARTAELSGGQKQLVNLAAGIAMRPRVLLLDEPTAQLDPVSARQLCDVLRVVNEQLGITVLVATHSPEFFVDMASCAFELCGGKVREVAVESLRFVQTDEPAYAPAGAQGGDTLSCDEPIRVRDAWFSYEREGAWVLRGLDASFREGAVNCIVGGNGCGKTTLLKAIAGILRLQRGKAHNELSQSQAYLPQDPRLLFVADTVTAEFPMSCTCHRDSSSGTLTAKHDKWPAFMSHLSQRSPLDLSGGQQQMLALAKLLAAHPRLLLLDEPAKGLDANEQMQLAESLRRIAAEGTTIIMATHDLAFASRVADAIALMFDGLIASCASPAAFFADAAYYKPRANAFTVAWDKARTVRAVEANATLSDTELHE